MSNVARELAQILGEEGLRELGLDANGNPVSGSFDEKLIRGSLAVASEAVPTPHSQIQEGYAIIANIRRVLGEGRDITMHHINSYVASAYGPRRDLVEAALAAARAERALLVESAGQPANLAEANPYHDPDTGEFASPGTVVKKQKGSYSLGGYGKGKSKSRVGAKGAKMGTDKKTGRRRALINWVATSRPCGRDARKVGKDIKCSTGKSAAQKAADVAARAARRSSSRTRAESVGWVKRDSAVSTLHDLLR